MYLSVGHVTNLKLEGTKAEFPHPSRCPHSHLWVPASNSDPVGLSLDRRRGNFQFLFFLPDPLFLPSIQPVRESCILFFTAFLSFVLCLVSGWRSSSEFLCLHFLFLMDLAEAEMRQK